jgi:predicted nuclease with TOPRIM domain
MAVKELEIEELLERVAAIKRENADLMAQRQQLKDELAEITAKLKKLRETPIVPPTIKPR